MEVMNLNNIDSTSLFLNRKNSKAFLNTKEEIIALTFNDTLLEFPLYCETSLNFILTNNLPFSLCDVPGELDDDGKLVLVKKLLKEGLLTTINHNEKNQHSIASFNKFKS
jgi:hypothetical protein